MSHVPVRITEGGDPRFERAYADLETLIAEIGTRAFDIFARESAGAGAALIEWAAADAGFARCPPAELTDTGHEFRLHVSVPGLNEKQIRLCASARSIIVEGRPAKTERCPNEQVLFTDLPVARLYRRIEVPEEIDPEEVHAHLHNGVLSLVATKRAWARKTRLAAAGHH